MVGEKRQLKNIWALCVFPKTHQLNQFLNKWGNPHRISKYKYSSKMYWLTEITQWNTPVALCVHKKLATENTNTLETKFKKCFKYREILYFCVEKASPESLVEQLVKIQALDPKEAYLISEFLGLEIERPSDAPSLTRKRRRAPVAPILPNIFEAKKHKAEEATETSKSENECNICMTNHSTEIMLPCGHRTMCFDCLDEMDQRGQLENCAIPSVTSFSFRFSFA